ncbi:MAG: diversity-generating retroelement protein Avd [Candidatus Omnitrophica bacterium]|nr:diversity-generating retroelement protein Avd [Candidatus Omnitrophota bacterium]MBU4303620.1 diversity-generating retroelement protein Avd [Candidatus Omnitrophota bacterium]MBU4467286.1 diversity-generating retroelement protein Avd [Candidatus Omnitrophota bacterium]MCG2708176.1 diversity-generating retroelement protein Avd [Candidatus Omnitrophota bacterium]
MARTEHLIIFQKVYDLIKEVYRDCNNFPKSQRFILGQRIENTAVNILEGIISANSTEKKLSDLLKVSLEIEKLRIFFRLSKDLAFLAFKRYEVLSAKLDEIGRMCGGWIKSL